MTHSFPTRRSSGLVRVALEMTFEEPEVRLDVEFGHDLAFAVFPALVGDPGDAVHHQHRRQGKLGIARAEQPSVPALDQLVVAVAVLPLERQNGLSHGHFPITTGNHYLTARDNTTHTRRTGNRLPPFTLRPPARLSTQQKSTG